MRCILNQGLNCSTFVSAAPPLPFYFRVRWAPNLPDSSRVVEPTPTDCGAGQVVGRQYSAGADSVILSQSERPDSLLIIRRQQIAGVEFSQGLRTHVWHDAGYGVLLGGLLGAAAVMGGKPSGMISGQAAMLGAVVIGPMGAIVGAVLGLIPTEDWVRLPLGPVRANITSMGLRLSIHRKLR